MKIRLLDSVRVRLTLWYVSVLALVLIAFSMALFALFSRAVNHRIDASLLAVIEVTINSLTNDLEEGQSHTSAAHSTVTELFNPQQALAVFDHAGKLLAENTAHNYYAKLPALDAIADGQNHIYTVREAEPHNNNDDDDNHRVVVRRASIPLSDTPFIILASQPLEATEEELESIREMLLYSVPIALTLAGLGGWFLARQSLIPIARMSEQAHRIGAENLDRRLPVVNSRDELGQLAITFNELLERLNASFAQQRQFMADASHELRTPLSVMHTTVDVLLERKRRDESEYRDAMQIIGEQTRRLARIVEDMFTLARADSGRYPLRRSKFYLDELLEEAARAASVLASSKNVRVDIVTVPDALFYGDEDLLRRMVLNLFDNAIKYTPAEGTVTLTLTRREDRYLITVTDTGAGIPAEAQAQIFERFFRADRVRTRNDGAPSGAGLGLAIARWIAAAHQGTLELARSDRSGTTFLATLPLSTGR